MGGDDLLQEDDKEFWLIYMVASGHYSTFTKSQEMHYNDESSGHFGKWHLHHIFYHIGWQYQLYWDTANYILVIQQIKNHIFVMSTMLMWHAACGAVTDARNCTTCKL